MRIAWLVLIFSAAGCLAQSPQACPWLSTGSAIEALGGPVGVDSHVDNDRQGTCRFARGTGKEQQSIDVTVGKVDTHPCSAGSAMVIGLGNEAVECKVANSGGTTLEIIAGRVRDIYFLIAMKSPGEREPSSPPARYPGDRDNASVLKRVAEQVVGNLY